MEGKKKIIFEEILWVILIIVVLVVGLLISNAIDDFNIDIGDEETNDTFVVENNKKYKDDVEDKVSELEAEKGLGEFYSKISDMKLSTVMNSGIGCDIILPKSFDEIVNEIEIGRLLEERNKLSSEEGYDFSKYLGKEVMLLGLRLDTGNDKIQEVIGIIYNEEVVGFWITPMFNDIEDCDITVIIKTFMDN
ncbi:DUF4830 domain-containing protein [Clostridium sp.]|uniref:DUF4830 domain-containing protein n=1 Tax=Clostridium sp. TaxID=1506 RepID=UPI003217A327